MVLAVGYLIEDMTAEIEVLQFLFSMVQ